MTIFERIINNEIPSYKVYEDDLVIAILDIQQATKGHTLVIPKKPFVNIFEIEDNVLQHLITITKKISIAINKAFDPSGINLLNNNGSMAGQTVFHYHMHILPRYNNDSIETLFNTKLVITKEDYENRAALIRAALL